LAGDIQVGLTQDQWFTDLLKDRPVIYIAGNHEFYGHNVKQIRDEAHIWESKINANAIQAGYDHRLHFLQNQTFVLGDTRFIAATLWSDFNKGDPMAMITGGQCMNDFRVIYNTINGKEYTFSPQQALEEHLVSKQFITDELNKLWYGKTVVVTHHAPSEQSVNIKYKGDPLNYCYFSNLEDLVDKTDLWFHGHMHDSVEYTIGNGRVVCNPRGYVGTPDLNRHFTDKLLEL
jgi:Calcineurin-like phosphoesterase